MDITKNIYQKFIDKELSLQDQLAVARSVLSNERSLLAFLQTSFSLFVAGVTIIHFFEVTLIILLGWAMIPIGLFVLIFGIIRYRRMKSLIHDVEFKTDAKILVKNTDDL